MYQQINVAEDVVKDIQRKDVGRQAAQDLLTSLIETHTSDTGFIESPVFKELQKDAENKRLEWERAKDSMVLEYVPKEVNNKVKNWSLDYGTNVLTIEI